MLNWLSPLESIITIVTGLIALGAGIWAGWERWNRRLHVVRLRTAKDRWFEPAMDLYDDPDIFPDWERDDREEIERWLEEARLARDRPTGPHEYLLAAIHRERVVGFFYGTFYRSISTLFVSYLIIPRRLTSSTREQIPRELFDALQSALKKDGNVPKAIVGEVDAPDAATADSPLNRRVGRIKLLIQRARQLDVTMRVIDAPYLQPSLDPHKRNMKEGPLLLLYGRFGEDVGSMLPKATVLELISFVYDELYGDCFINDAAKDAEWRKYLQDLRDKVAVSLPDVVPCRRSAEEVQSSSQSL